MTKILIVSDSHGWTDELQSIKDKHSAEVDVMIHCGDSELMADDPAIAGFVTVRGNCDNAQKYPEDAEVDVAGRKVFVTHGHLYNVKSSLMNLSYRAKEFHANIVCFGHSHLLGLEMIDGVLFINPGSIRLPRGRRERTYVILELKEDFVHVYVYDLDDGEIKALRQEFPLAKQI
jgi:uncharacterized protein